jgi:hypothetical protein
VFFVVFQYADEKIGECAWSYDCLYEEGMVQKLFSQLMDTDMWLFKDIMGSKVVMAS